MGAGHDGAAKELRRRLEARGHRVEVIDFLDAVAFHIGPVLRWFYQVQLRYFPWSYEFSYQLAPLLRGSRGHARHVAHAAQAPQGDQGSSVPTRSCRCTRSRHSCSDACGRKKQLRVPVRHLPHRLRGPLALGAPRHRPPPRGQRALGRRRPRRAAARMPARTGPLVGERFRDSRVDRDAVRSSARPRPRRPRRARRRRLVGRRRRRSPPSRRSAQSGEFHPITVCGRDEKLQRRAREPRLRDRHRLDRRDARAHDRGRRAGGERRWAHLHGGVRGRAARDHVPARSPGTARTTPR